MPHTCESLSLPVQRMSDKHVQKGLAKYTRHAETAFSYALKHVQTEHDAEAIHRLRVTSRHMKFILSLLQFIYSDLDDHMDRKHCQKRLRAGMRACAPLRDLDIVAQLITSHASSKDRRWAATQRLIEQQRTAQQIKTFEVLRTLDGKGVSDEFRQLSKLLRNHKLSTKKHHAMDRSLQRYLQKLVNKMHKQLDGLSTIRPPRSAQTPKRIVPENGTDKASASQQVSAAEMEAKLVQELHQLRLTIKRIKDFGRVMQTISPTSAWDNALNHLQQWQDRLGAIQDIEMGIVLLDNTDPNVAGAPTTKKQVRGQTSLKQTLRRSKSRHIRNTTMMLDGLAQVATEFQKIFDAQMGLAEDTSPQP